MRRDQVASWSGLGQEFASHIRAMGAVLGEQVAPGDDGLCALTGSCRRFETVEPNGTPIKPVDPVIG